ncbi:unnamed protein product, partial [Prorocentrum cordatum]
MCDLTSFDKNGALMVRRDKDGALGFADEILVTRGFLDDKQAALMDLERQVEELTSRIDFQLRHRDSYHKEKMAELQEKYSEEIETERRKFEASGVNRRDGARVRGQDTGFGRVAQQADTGAGAVLSAEDACRGAALPQARDGPGPREARVGGAARAAAEGAQQHRAEHEAGLREAEEPGQRPAGPHHQGEGPGPQAAPG